MAVKPTSLPRWADSGGDIVEPTSGKKDVGWVSAERPPAQYFNWLLNLIYQWLSYLNDGDLVGDHTIDGTLDVGRQNDVTGVDTTAETLDVGTHNWETEDGPVRITSTGTLPGGLSAGTDYWVIDVDSDTIALATSQANAAADIRVNLTSAGTGTRTISDAVQVLDLAEGKLAYRDEKHGDKVLMVGAMSGVGTGLTVNDGYLNTTGVVRISIPLKEGDRIRSTQYIYQRAGGTLTIALKRIDSGGTVTTVSTEIIDTTSTGWQFAAGAVADHAVVADSLYYVEFSQVLSNSDVAGAHVTYDRP